MQNVTNTVEANTAQLEYAVSSATNAGVYALDQNHQNTLHALLLARGWALDTTCSAYIGYTHPDHTHMIYMHEAD